MVDVSLETLLRHADRIGPRRWLPVIGVAGLVGSFLLMLATSGTNEVGTIVFVPWVAVLAIELGPLFGALAGVAAIGLYLAAAPLINAPTTATALTTRAATLILVGVAAGVAARRIAADAEELRRRAALRRALVDSTRDGICFADLDGNVVLANAPLRQLALALGLPPSGTVTERLLSLAGRTTEPVRYRERMLALATSLDESEDEFELADGGRIFRGYTAPVHEPNGRLLGRVWTLREVTDDRRLERLRDAFVASVSHELRTPLTSISGFVEMLEDEEASLSTPAREYLAVIKRGTARLHTIVEELLLVAQIEADRFEVAPEPSDLAELTTAAVDVARPGAAQKGVSLEVRAGAPLPVEADPQRLGQVLDNLISNAVKFTPTGGSVVVDVHNGGGLATVEISDTGVGIPANEVGKLFTRFYRASNAAGRAVPGTGLGLVIAKAIVDAHGGSIALESREGAGTRVTVCLPVG